MGLTSTHFFCGGGGDTQGLLQAGFTPLIAANHDAASIATHQANFPDCTHLNTNLEQVEMRKLARTDVLWASPICSEISPAGGRKRRAGAAARRAGQLSIFDDGDEAPMSDTGFERTRVTALTIISAAEVHRYDVVMGENVVEFGTDWELFDWWVQGMRILGYEHQLINVNAAHVGDDRILPAPQWRDRLFFIFSRKGINLPKLAPRPWAWCEPCDQVVRAYQWWKNPKAAIGKYRMQYLYRCPNQTCRHRVLEPFVRPAADIIDFTNPGARIGERAKPLAANTLHRIQAGLDKFTGQHVVVTVNHGGHDGRHFLPWHQPFPVRSTKIGEGLLTPPLLAPAEPTPASAAQPVTDTPAVIGHTDSEHHLAAAHTVARLWQPGGGSDGTDPAPLAAPLTSHERQRPPCPPFIAQLRNHGTARPVTEPLTTITSGGNHHALVVPQHRTGTLTEQQEQCASALTADARHGLLTGLSIEVDDCFFRMVQPREQFLAQAFPPGYRLLGTKTEQTAQAGNAVPVNVAQWIGEHVLSVLNGGHRH